MPRFGLSLKIFLGTAAVVTAVLLATLVVTSASARNSADRAIQRGLGETNARIAEQLQARQDGLAGKLGVFAQNSVVVATVLADTSGNSAFDQAGEAVAASDARWVQFADTNAIVLAKSDDRAAKGRDVSNSPLVLGALQGKTMTGLGVSGDTAIVQLVALPLLADLNTRSARSVSGVIMGALQVGDSLARAIGEVTGSEVVFYVIDKNDAPRVAGATVAAADRDALQRVLRERMRDTATTTSKRSPAADSAKKTASAMGAASEHTGISLGGRAYIGQMTPLLSVRGAPVGGFLSLRSLDAELAPYYSLRKGLLLTGALGLIVAFLLSAAITRQIVRPVRALVIATRRAADGDYVAEIPAHGDDEIGTLAEAVRRLLGD